MIKLKPREIQEYRCDYCNKKYRTMKPCENHERKCYSNPDRECEVCVHTGWESWNTLVAGLGVIPDGGGADCWACKIAAERGGKCYIENYQPDKKESR